MIKSCNGKVEVSGPELVVQADLAFIIHGFVEEGRFTKEQIQETVDTAFMSEEELDASINKSLEELGLTREEAFAGAVLSSIFGDIL